MLTEEGFEILDTFVKNGALRYNEIRDHKLTDDEKHVKIKKFLGAYIKLLDDYKWIEKIEQEDGRKNLHAKYDITEAGLRHHKKYLKAKRSAKVRKMPIFATANIISFCTLIVMLFGLRYQSSDLSDAEYKMRNTILHSLRFTRKPE